MRVTSTTTTERRASGIDASAKRPRSTRPANRGSSFSTASPRPCRRRIRGGPSKAQNITQIRPFSRRWAIVSAPLPWTSRYATVCGSSTAKEPIGPFGETLTWPSASSGADATKNSDCRAIQSRWWSVSSSKTLATAPHSLRGRPRGVRSAPMPRRRAASAVPVLLAAAVAGCAARAAPAAAAPLWPSMRHDVRNTGASDVRPRPYRRARPWTFHTARGVFSTPVLDARGDVYVGSADRSFVALSPTGRLRWRIWTGGLIDAAAVLGPGPAVTFGAGDEVLRRVRTARPPSELWRTLPTLPPAPGQLVRWWEGNPQL